MDSDRPVEESNIYPLELPCNASSHRKNHWQQKPRAICQPIRAPDLLCNL